ncbi:unnamed protein product, partial [Rotaria sp. Silwood2]
GSLIVKWGFTTPDYEYTQNLAKNFVEKAQKPFSVDLLVLSKAVPADYLIEWEQIPSVLQLNPSDFESKYDRDYRGWSANDSVQQRGNRPYYRPLGWYRHALRVLDKYGNDSRWLGMTNGPGEWPIAYHGTKRDAVAPILKDGLKPAGCDYYREELVHKYGSLREKGIYL